VDLNVCALCSDFKSLKFDIREDEYPLNLFGFVLTKDNFNENLLNKFDTDLPIDDDIQIHLEGKPITSNFNRPLHKINFSKPLISNFLVRQIKPPN